MNHPTLPMLRAFLRSLSVADAGLLLHLLECPRCSRRAWKELSPRPMRRRPGEPRPADLAEDGEAATASAEPPETPAGPLAAAELCRDLARERQEEGRLDEGLALFERAAVLYGRAGRPREQAAVLGDLASFHLELRQEEEALAVFERILALGSAVADPGLATGSATGIAGRLATLEDPLEGRRLLTALRERLGRRRVVQQRLDLARSEGLLAAFTRQEHPAEKLFRDAWAGYLRAGAPEHAMLAVTDLAALLLRQGRAATLRDLAAEIRRSFHGRDLPFVVRTALDRLLPALESGQVPIELLAELSLNLARDLAEPAASSAPGASQD
jgi:tetratricopeptide (TPR) repeat protein